MLDIKDLTREFTRRGSAFAAVDHVNLHVDAGEFVAIVGRSGNGKSTLLNLVTGLLKPTSGTVTLDGRDVVSLNDREMSALRNQVIGFVTQSQTLLPNLSVIDNVILPAVLSGHAVVDDDGLDGDVADGDVADGDVADDPAGAAPASGMPDVIAPAPVAEAAAPDALERRATRLLDLLQVADLASCYPKELSGGEMRRVSIARALMNRPKLLIADEPTGDLDAESTAIVMRLLREVAGRGTAVLMVTHDPDALEYADRIYRMDRGVLAEA
ncbi:MAG: ABC transporter ATP-binding protein [Bifidobacterium scardovii]|uniref:ABC transporter ATP-binding protein n=1 Tax=Bifidobacterium scardovii TaxID=158787 RepID=UPI00066594AB|nr:ABC transporter ATP-binding protein [Bifidobacterium scardovii]MBS6947655.1 ABC transporter ATP-binding protein [Bifidobacterium scardovii]MDU2421186.1 ABC transporter ATP-binding protein [Bifidobacterium scardovii]MDU3735475.1 ABC transporter ATP-binding protein [Bifidobacterium scardovii]MDU5298213.1 ABC transporter ATP-binding protein [Bifidobacterium scardovii]MDU5610497.1 ABC transporter ATP-binding protein [Bifidobacterium scardovii]